MVVLLLGFYLNHLRLLITIEAPPLLEPFPRLDCMRGKEADNNYVKLYQLADFFAQNEVYFSFITARLVNVST